MGFGSYTYIEESYSIGDLDLKEIGGHFGGILGSTDGNNINIKNCYNIMDIKTNSNAGGIAGQVYGGNIEQCFHIGDISGGGRIGGICGYDEWGDSQIKNCYNIGKISGTQLSAGIISGFGARIFNCYSIGVIKSCKAMIHYNYSKKPMLNCFARRHDCDSFSDNKVLTNGEILSIMGGSNGEACEVLFDDEFKEEGMITKLNNLMSIDEEGTVIETPQNVWKIDTEGINDGYPIFTWQE